MMPSSTPTSRSMSRKASIHKIAPKTMPKSTPNITPKTVHKQDDVFMVAVYVCNKTGYASRTKHKVVVHQKEHNCAGAGISKAWVKMEE